MDWAARRAHARGRGRAAVWSGQVATRKSASAYLAELEHRCDAAGIRRDPEMWAPAEASEDLAIIRAVITLPWHEDDHSLRVLEDIDMRVSAADPRVYYAYQLVVDGERRWGYHRHRPHAPEYWENHFHDYRFPRDHPRHLQEATRRLLEAVSHADDFLTRRGTPLAP